MGHDYSTSKKVDVTLKALRQLLDVIEIGSEEQIKKTASAIKRGLEEELPK